MFIKLKLMNSSQWLVSSWMLKFHVRTSVFAFFFLFVSRSLARSGRENWPEKRIWTLVNINFLFVIASSQMKIHQKKIDFLFLLENFIFFFLDKSHDRDCQNEQHLIFQNRKKFTSSYERSAFVIMIWVFFLFLFL